jgi:hypothetical protein
VARSADTAGSPAEEAPLESIASLPRLEATTPAGDELVLEIRGTQPFTARIPGDAVNVRWELDGRAMGTAAEQFVLDAGATAEPGIHWVALVAGEESARRLLRMWQVKVVPEIRFTAVMPASQVLEERQGDEVELRAEVGDHAPELVTYRWTVDGEPVRGVGGARYLFTAEHSGTSHVEVRAVVNRSSAEVRHSWEVKVRGGSPAAPRDPAAIRGELAGWVAPYCSAFERKELPRLIELGEVEEGEEARKLEHRLRSMNALTVRCTNPSILIDHDGARVSFDRMDHWADAQGIPRELDYGEVTKPLRRERGRWVIAR